MNDQHTPLSMSESSPWSVEHYGFEDRAQRGAVPGRPAVRGPGAAAARVSPRAGHRRPGRLRGLLAATAFVVGLTAGGAGFAAAQTSPPDREPGRGTVENVGAFDQGPGGDRGGSR